MNIDPDTLDAMVPNLLLQPIVENAIRHGVIACVGKGRIDIQSEHENGSLRLRVSDNGPGLKAANDDEAKATRNGFGFSLTRERLERLYAAEQKFSLHDRPEGGLEVTLEIPFIKAS